MSRKLSDLNKRLAKVEQLAAHIARRKNSSTVIAIRIHWA